MSLRFSYDMPGTALALWKTVPGLPSSRLQRGGPGQIITQLQQQGYENVVCVCGVDPSKNMVETP